MGESLCYSWLKHIKGCQVVQTNWKASMMWKHYNVNRNFISLLTVNLAATTVFQQTECDVIGLNIDGNKRTVYAVEVAYHKGGLGYTNNLQKIHDKCIRIAACMRACFPGHTINIYFTSPKVGNTLRTQIKQNIDGVLNNKIQNFDPNITIQTILDKDFTCRIITPLIICQDEITDSSEAFVRSCQMLMLHQPSIINCQNYMTNDTFNEFPIPGVLAKLVMGQILKRMPISSQDFKDLMNQNYCSNNFGMGTWTVVTNTLNAARGHYWVVPFKGSKQPYYLTNQWTGQNKQRLINWILNHRQFLY